MGRMPTDEDCAKVKKVVEDVSRRRFPELDIVRVEVTGDLDRYDKDEDPLYFVRVIFDNPFEKLEAKKTYDTVQHLQPKLDELGIHGFPVVQYHSTEMVERREKLERQKKMERQKNWERQKKWEGRR